MTIDRVRARYGELGLDRLLSAIPPHMRDELPPDLHFLPSATFSFELWAELLLAADGLFSDFARASSREGYAALLRTAYKNWVRPGDAVESIKRLPHLWEQVTKGLGEYEVFERDDAVVIRVKLNGVNDRYRRVTEERVAGTIEAMIKASGRRGTVRRVPETNGHTEFVVRTTRSMMNVPSG
jgi:hypothetical protein